MVNLEDAYTQEVQMMPFLLYHNTGLFELIGAGAIAAHIALPASCLNVNGFSSYITCTVLRPDTFCMPLMSQLSSQQKEREKKK